MVREEDHRLAKGQRHVLSPLASKLADVLECMKQPVEPKTPTAIVRIGAEGGSLTLVGRQVTEGEWQYCLGSRDQSAAMLSAEDSTAEVRKDSLWVDGWPAAMILLDRYPWATLAGLEVNEAFREIVFAEVVRRLSARRRDSWSESALKRWAKVCKQPIGVTE